MAAALGSAAVGLAFSRQRVPIEKREPGAEYSKPPEPTRSNSLFPDKRTRSIERYKAGGLMAARWHAKVKNSVSGQPIKIFKIGTCKFGTRDIDTPRPETTSRSGRSEKRENAGRSKRPGLEFAGIFEPRS
jgi:hypothetical protein